MPIPVFSRRSILASALILPLAACAAGSGLTRRSPRLEDIVRNHVRARGGAAALDRVRSIQMDVEIVEQGQTLRGQYSADAAGLVRIDIYVDGQWAGSEGVDRLGVWLRQAGQPPRDSVATGSRNALLHGAENHLFGLHRFSERGHSLRLMPGTAIDGIDYQVVEITYSTGHVSYFYIDPSSWLITRRRDERAYHPDVSAEQRRVETLYSDHRSVDGVVAAHLNVDVDLASGAVLSTNQVLRRTLNPDLPTGLFDRNWTPPAAPTPISR